MRAHPHRPGPAGPTRRRPRPARGAALLVAMVLLTVVATLAAGMVWQQWRAVEVEGAERARAQAALLLTGGIDIGRHVLRENARQVRPEFKRKQFQQLVNLPLEESSLSSLLAADRNNNATVDLDAFISGGLTDAQGRYNLMNLFAGDGQLDPKQVAVLERLCTLVGVSGGVAADLARQLQLARAATDPAAPLMPERVDDLVWLGLDADSLARLSPHLVLLPVATPVNLNTAGREVLAAVLPGMDLGGADRLIRQREQKPLDQPPVDTATGQPVPGVGLDSRFAFVQGRLRVGNRVQQELALLEVRNGPRVTVLQRQRLPVQLTGGSGAPP